MSETIQLMLDFAEGPVFRFAFALMVLGALRAVLVGLSDTVAAYVTHEDRRVFWHKFRLRVLWLTFPSFLLRRARPRCRGAMFAYHVGLCFTSLVFRFSAILVPAFMVEHVHLWERGLGVAWGTLPPGIADGLSLVTILAGLVLFLGRLYSPALREIEPPWSFLKPLLLILPFVTGMLAMHPTWSPVDYHVVRLLHALSAAVVFVMIPFARMLTCMHTPLTRVLPEAEWRVATGAAVEAPLASASE